MDASLPPDGWIPMHRWGECRMWERPGVLFEVRNAAGQRMQLTCTLPFPGAPWDWTAPPLEFRVIAAGPPRPSGPIPSPARPR